MISLLLSYKYIKRRRYYYRIVDIETLKVILKRNKITQKELADLFSISQRMLTKKFKLREFTSSELEIMLHILDFGRYHPMDVFFDTISTKNLGINAYGSKENRLAFEKKREISKMLEEAEGKKNKAKEGQLTNAKNVNITKE